MAKHLINLIAQSPPEVLQPSVWDKYGLPGLVILVLFGALFTLFRLHREERKELTVMHREERDEWRTAAESRQDASLERERGLMQVMNNLESAIREQKDST